MYRRFTIPALLATLLVATLATGSAGAATPASRAAIGPATFSSVMAPASGDARVRLARFELDREPVTNAQFLAFVSRHPEWRRDRVARLFADASYLSHWSAPAALGAGAVADQPVTHVSWFAARAYCQAQNARLPRWHEWEYAAAADERRADARADPAWRERILEWYGRSSAGPLQPIGRTPANVHGVRDLHGLVWEWVEDYSALMLNDDGRDPGDPNALRFCGAGALSMKDSEAYPMYMRIAMLSSLEAQYTTANVGFRCATGGAP